MRHSTRRGFLRDVGRGMIVATVGYQVAGDLELAPAIADEGPADRLQFGPLEPLVRLMQETEPSRLMSVLIQRLKQGTRLEKLVAAAALSNARTFGGQDYVGFHTIMALAPSYRMAGQLSGELQPLPVLKVIFRNSKRIQEHGGPRSEVLRPVAGDPNLNGSADGRALLEAVRRKEMDRAEQIFAAISAHPAEQAFNELLVAVQDNSEVHRVVLPYRAWDLLGIIGPEHAHTLLRQSVRYCVQNESPKYRESVGGGREILPKLLDEYKLLGEARAQRAIDDAWVASMTDTIFRSTPADAAEAAAAALAEGIPGEAIGEAICLAANQLVLRDAGRPASQARPPEKLVGSIHGDSIGVHASDSANAWRNMARTGDRRNRVACLILAAHQVAFDRTSRGGDFLNWQPYPTAEHLKQVRGKSHQDLLSEAEASIRENDQGRACAAVHRCGELNPDPQPVVDMLLRYSVSEDGALHAEKYFQTVAEDFAATRASLRWRHLLGLARVTASAYGYPAPGLQEARELLET